MWFLPLLVVGAIAVAVASRSKREPAPPSRQLAPPSTPPRVAGSAGLPGPISVLGEILRVGQYPPPTVVLCAIAEAQSIGRNDLASDIVRVFVAPVVYRHQRARERGVRGPSHYERGSCELPRSPRGSADGRGAVYAPPVPFHAVAPPAPPVAAPWADAATSAPPSAQPMAPSAAAPMAPPAAPPTAPPSASPMMAPPSVAPPMVSPTSMDDEINALLHADPVRFMELVSRSGTFPSTARAPRPSSEAETLVSQLSQLPGFAAGGVVLDPSSGTEAFEVRWLRGHQAPPLPPAVDGRPVRFVPTDALAVPHVPAATPAPLPTSVPPPVTQPTGLPPETVAQMQEAAGLPEAADRTRAMAPGSPIPGVSDGAWRNFVVLLSREAPQFSSSRHVGQYRHRRERLAELGIDPAAIADSAQAQRTALDVDLADAHRHGVASELFSQHLGRPVTLPGREGAETITLSGVLGVIQCAGLEGAVGWLERPSDRKRYPHTTQAFLQTNGVF